MIFCFNYDAIGRGKKAVKINQNLPGMDSIPSRLRTVFQSREMGKSDFWHGLWTADFRTFLHHIVYE